MAEGGQRSADDLTLSGWVSSREVRKFSQSSSPLSPGDTVSFPSPLTENKRWRSRVASCDIQVQQGSGQGVLICLGLSRDNPLSSVLGVSSYPALALLTNHHVIPCSDDIFTRKIKINICNQKYSLENKIDRFISCCGPNGIWGGKKHDHPESCPFRADFSLLVLSKVFSEKIKTPDLLFPVVMPLDMTSLKKALNSERFYMFCLENDHVVEEEITMQPLASPSDDQLIESQIQAYQGMCNLKYNSNHTIVPGTSGAGIFFKRDTERILLGIHTSTEEDRSAHYGITMHRIFHAIAGGDVCGLIPCLSLFKEAHDRGKVEAKWYDHLRKSLQLRPFQQVQAEDGKDDLTFGNQLKAINYLMKMDKPRIFSLERLDDPLILHSVELLAALFRCFETVSHSKANERIGEIFQGESEEFRERVRRVGNLVIHLLNDAHSSKNQPLVQTCFLCWRQMMYFPDDSFKDSWKVSQIKQIRDDNAYLNNCDIQRAFGDISENYRAFLRQYQEQRQQQEHQQEIDELMQKHQEEIGEHTQRHQQAMDEHQEEVGEHTRRHQQEMDELVQGHQKEIGEHTRSQQEMDQLAQKQQEEHVQRYQRHERQNEELTQRFQEDIDEHTRRHKQEIEEARREIQSLKSEIQSLKSDYEKQIKVLSDENARLLNQQLSKPSRHYSSPPSLTTRSSLYPTRDYHDSIAPDLVEGFWNLCAYDLLKNDVKLRNAVSDYFSKVGGSTGSTTWEHLIHKLQEEFQHFSMNAKELDSEHVSEIILKILAEWRKHKTVTVEVFCSFSEKQLGIRAVREVFTKASAETQDVFDSLKLTLDSSKEVAV